VIMERLKRKHSFRTFTFICAAMALYGCVRSDVKQQLQGQAVVDSKISGFYEAYLRTDAEQARSNLIKTVQMLEEDSQITDRYKFTFLRLTYARLYVLERRLTNDAAAAAALIKLRYCILRGSELDGNTTESSMEAVSQATPESIVEMVTETDKKATGGKAPVYFAPH
jgi:hypothetical protein